MKYIIFDLDGTLANCDHRQHFLQSEPRDWRSFFLACDQDTPVTAVVDTFKALYAYYLAIDAEHFHFIIFSGRSDIAKDKTVEWLSANQIPYDHLFMRPEGDFTPDHVLKENWLDQIGPENVLFCLDDRQVVVDMWRRRGVTCFQVAPGDF